MLRLLAMLLIALPLSAVAELSHPRLLLTPDDVAAIRASIANTPRFQKSFEEARAAIDQALASLPDVPVPADAGGGYTHEQHKRNGVAIHDAGVAYQLTGDSRYADFAKNLLLAYADMYPTLGEHPKRKELTPGRLFWQSLNESVWLVWTIQGYDAIVETLSAAEREKIEQLLLRPMAEFLSVEAPQTFDKIHNHGTWAVAAVGMTGYVLGDDSYVRKALYGLNEDGSAGFLKQLDELFSPDGYYSEGPYYQRYALMPFVVFARSIETNDPELEIFAYRDGILLKAIYTCIDLSYAELFFPINDAIKDKGLDTVELRYGIASAFAITGDDGLLSIAERQGSVVLTGDGFQMAQAIDNGEAEPFAFDSRLLLDGPAGRQGALAILRYGAGSGHQAAVFKATAQGMGHGHFDKLHWLYYDNGNEIVTDYGAARFLNVEQKYGGHYLPENTSWAKQTIAHNTLVVDEQSHFDGNLRVAERLHPDVLFFESTSVVQISAARMAGAYEDVSFQRVLAMVRGISPHGAIVIDVLRAEAPTSRHQYDLPLHFAGQFIASSHDLQVQTGGLQPLGEANGYQHLWLKASAAVEAGQNYAMTWLRDDRFYTYTSVAEQDTQVLFTELGANDPDLNLRREQALILRRNGAGNAAFVSVLEPHGEYNGPAEYTVGNYPHVTAIARLGDGASDLIRITTRDGQQRYVGLSWNANNDVCHSVDADGAKYEWCGFYAIFDSAGAK